MRSSSWANNKIAHLNDFVTFKWQKDLWIFIKEEIYFLVFYSIKDSPKNTVTKTKEKKKLLLTFLAYLLSLQIYLVLSSLLNQSVPSRGSILWTWAVRPKGIVVGISSMPLFLGSFFVVSWSNPLWNTNNNVVIL